MSPPVVGGSEVHCVTLKRIFPQGGEPDLSEGQYLAKPEELPALFEGICNIFGDVRDAVTIEQDGVDVTAHVFDRRWEGEGDTAGSPA